tara:strand:+ start:44 stop:388 length:345 start_codon:yes stop_codon:yes gene_type:complete
MKNLLAILIILAIIVALYTGDEVVKDANKKSAVDKVYNILNALASVQGRNIDEVLVKRELMKLTIPELNHLNVFATKIYNGDLLDTLGSLERTKNILAKTDLYSMVLGLLTQSY